MKIVAISLTAVLSLSTSVAQARDKSPTARKVAQIGLELGPTWQGRNDVRIPGNSGDEFSLLDVAGVGPFLAGRLWVNWAPWRRHEFRFVWAPLRIEGTQALKQPISFDDTQFATGIDTKGAYKFDTYRWTYRFVFYDGERWKWRIGGTLLLRDAEISLLQGGAYASNSNIGLVPLIHFAGSVRFAQRWSAELTADGLYVGKLGRAFDVALRFGFDVTDSWTAFAGYRMLEGGSDNDDVYTFAWLHYAVFALAYRF